MQMFYEDEQVSMFAPDSCAGKMSPAHSPVGSKREMTSGSSWRKHSELVYQEFMFLKITLGDGDILGQPYWEILSPYVGESSTLNYVQPNIIERPGTASIGRNQFPVGFAQQVATPRGEVQGHERYRT